MCIYIYSVSVFFVWVCAVRLHKYKCVCIWIWYLIRYLGILNICWMLFSTTVLQVIAHMVFYEHSLQLHLTYILPHPSHSVCLSVCLLFLLTWSICGISSEPRIIFLVLWALNEETSAGVHIFLFFFFLTCFFLHHKSSHHCHVAPHPSRLSSSRAVNLIRKRA